MMRVRKRSGVVLLRLTGVDRKGSVSTMWSSFDSDRFLRRRALSIKFKLFERESWKAGWLAKNGEPSDRFPLGLRRKKTGEQWRDRHITWQQHTMVVAAAVRWWQMDDCCCTAATQNVTAHIFSGEMGSPKWWLIEEEKTWKRRRRRNVQLPWRDYESHIKELIERRKSRPFFSAFIEFRRGRSSEKKGRREGVASEAFRSVPKDYWRSAAGKYRDFR